MAPPKRRKCMRMLLRVSIPVEAGNAAAKAGTLGSTVERILADLKPEAAYFFADDNGNRSVPDAGWTTIAPCSFHDDSSQVRVAGFGDASTPGSLTTGILAGYSTAITHQLPSARKTGYRA